MGMDSPNHTKSSPSGSRFVPDTAVGHRDSGGKFDTSGKSQALRISRRHAKIDAIDPKQFVGRVGAKRNPPSRSTMRQNPASTFG
jgi:hypothetical protein